MTPKNAIEIITKHDIAKCVFWVGAGISYAAPTNLPLGWDLTKFALTETCGENAQQKIFSIWDQANKIAKTSSPFCNPLGSIPRLETILGEIDDVKNMLKSSGFDFLKGFSVFADAPFNMNHLLLANLMSKGATIITTNFDTAIEGAYHSLNNKNHLSHQIRHDIDVLTDKNNFSGSIWHIHGLATNTALLGATVSKVKEGLPKSFQKYLDGMLLNETLIIFVGYSASDSFDVNPYFNNKPASTKSKAIFIQHGAGSAPQNAHQLGRAFASFTVENHNTEKFLQKISNHKKSLPHISFNWEDAFKKAMNVKNIAITSHFTMCKVANALGINIDRIDSSAYRKALQAEKYYKSTDFHKTLAIIQRTRGDNKKEKAHDITVQTAETDLLGYYYSQGNYQKAQQFAKSIDDIFKDSENKNIELEWRTYTSLGAYCRPLITQHLKSFHANPRKEDLPTIYKLIELTKSLGKRPLKEVKYINQSATALRYNFLLNSMLNKDTKESEKIVLSIYGEGASIVGYVSAFRDLSIKHYFLAKHRKSKQSFLKAYKYALNSYKLAKLIGEQSGIKRARKMLLAFSIIRFLFVFR